MGLFNSILKGTKSSNLCSLQVNTDQLKNLFTTKNTAQF